MKIPEGTGGVRWAQVGGGHFRHQTSVCGHPRSEQVNVTVRNLNGLIGWWGRWLRSTLGGQALPDRPESRSEAWTLTEGKLATLQVSNIFTEISSHTVKFSLLKQFSGFQFTQSLAAITTV